MVAPITGPIFSSIGNNTDNEGSFRINRWKYKQMKPFNKALAYRFEKLVTVKADRWGSAGNFGGFANASTGKSPWWLYAYPFHWNPPDYWELVAAVQKARERFFSKMGESAEVMVALAERRQALDMMTSRVLQIYRFCRSLRRFDLKGAARELNVTADPRTRKILADGGVRSKSKSFSAAYLEFHFGWSPLISDIGNAMELLDSPIPFGKLVGTGRYPINWTTRTNNPPHWGWQQYATHQGLVKAKVGASVEVTNPNLYLASRMGLTNPATVAWELVPFSFVVDWFVNVSDYLGQFSELHGVRLVEPYFSFLVEERCLGRYVTSTGGWTIHSHAVTAERRLGIPSVTLGLRPPWTLSPRRALAAISLLIQKGLK